jgi:hypothetical protein
MRAAATTIKENVTLSVRTWWIIILMLGYLVFNPDKVLDLVPASYWLTVDEITVHDGPRDPDLIFLHVDRTIHRHFAADWLVEIEAKRGDRYTPICTRRGSNDYSTDATLPVPLNLSWWMNSDNCVIPQGRYRLVTRWDLDIGSGKTVRKKSNDFSIR